MGFLVWIKKILGIYNMEKKINLILFGPPGSGKGTQAEKLVEKYGLLHVSTGDLFRYEIGNKTPLGMKAKEYMSKGHLVPDAVTIGMLKNKVEANPDVKGFIFDGFPRTVAQAEALDTYLSTKDESVSKLIALDVAEEEIVARLLKRGETSGRSDDQNEEVIKNRIDVYKKETAIVFDHYKKSNLSQSVEGMGTIDEIFDRLSSAIDSI